MKLTSVVRKYSSLKTGSLLLLLRRFSFRFFFRFFCVIVSSRRRLLRAENTNAMLCSQRSQLELDVLRERLKEEEAAAALLAESKQKLVDELEASCRASDAASWRASLSVTPAVCCGAASEFDAKLVRRGQRARGRRSSRKGSKKKKETGKQTHRH